jgi:hypothetical protein
MANLPNAVTAPRSSTPAPSLPPAYPEFPPDRAPPIPIYHADICGPAPSIAGRSGRYTKPLHPRPSLILGAAQLEAKAIVAVLQEKHDEALAEVPWREQAGPVQVGSALRHGFNLAAARVSEFRNDLGKSLAEKSEDELNSAQRCKLDSARMRTLKKIDENTKTAEDLKAFCEKFLAETSAPNQ